MEIVEDFVEQLYNNNGKPWKSSRIFRVRPKTLEIFEDLAFFMFSCLFFHFFIFSCFFFHLFFFLDAQNGKIVKKFLL